MKVGALIAGLYLLTAGPVAASVVEVDEPAVCYVCHAES